MRRLLELLIVLDRHTEFVPYAEEAEAAARAVGLHTVRIGNRHLLSHDY